MTLYFGTKILIALIIFSLTFGLLIMLAISWFSKNIYIVFVLTCVFTLIELSAFGFFNLFNPDLEQTVRFILYVYLRFLFFGNLHLYFKNDLAQERR